MIISIHTVSKSDMSSFCRKYFVLVLLTIHLFACYVISAMYQYLYFLFSMYKSRKISISIWFSNKSCEFYEFIDSI
jgi:hypothetical protein